MSIVAADLPLFLPATLATSLTAPTSIGGATTATQITGSSIGEVLFAMSANTYGGATKTQYGKLFQGNAHATIDLTSAVMFLDNAMDDSAGGYVTTAVSTSASDGSNVTLRVIGETVSADAQDEFAMNGTTAATGSTTLASRWCCELRDTSTGALTPAVGTISIKENGVVIAILSPGMCSVTAEIKFGLAATLNDTATTTDASTAPGGISFAKPRTAAAGTAVANSGTLTALAEQGVWLKWECRDGRRASADVEIYLRCQGETT